MDGTAFLWGFIFGAIGLGYFVYGKKQQKLMPLAVGIALMAFPYFVSGTAMTLLVGFGLIALSWFGRDWI